MKKIQNWKDLVKGVNIYNNEETRLKECIKICLSKRQSINKIKDFTEAKIR